MAESKRYSEFSCESDETKKRSAEQSALIKELFDLEGLLVKEKSRFRKFLEEKLRLNMALWLGEDTPGADTLDRVSYLLAFVFLACLITLAIMSGNLFAAPLFLLIPSVITTVVGVLYALYRTVMPRQKCATTEQAAFIRLLRGNGKRNKLQIGERISEGLLCHLRPPSNDSNERTSLLF